MKKQILSLFISVFLVVICPAFVYADGETDTLTQSTDNTYAIFEEDDMISYNITWNGNGITQVDKLNISVEDYFGDTVYSQTVSLEENTESYLLKLTNMGVGHFRLITELVYNTTNSVTSEKMFSVVPQIELRRDSSESFFGFNTLLTHSSSENTLNGTNVDEFVHTVSLAGVPNVREMIVGHEIFPYPDYNSEIDMKTWERSSHYEAVMGAYRKEKLKVQLMFHTMYNSTYDYRNENQWSDANHIIPDNLIASYSFSKQLTEEYKDIIDSFELYNEPDLSGSHATTSDGADRYAAFAKALAIGVNDADPNVNISLSGFSGKRAYIKQVYRNDISDYIDGLAFHQYRVYATKNNDDLLDYSTGAQLHIKEASEYGLSDKEVYFNETGLQVPLKEAQSYEMSDTEQRAQARYTVTSAIKGISYGETKHYMFKHGYINERNYGYGTMSKDNQPYAVYSAVSALTNSIGNGKYAGTVKNLPDGAEGYAFEDGDETVLCFWSKNDNTKVSVPAEKNVTHIDIMGRETTVVPKNGSVEISVGKDIVYLRMGDNDCDNIISPSGFAEKKKKNNSIGKAQRIVLNQQFDDEAEVNVLNSGIYKLSTEESNTVYLDVFNFNSEAVTVKIFANTGGEWEVTPCDDFDAVTIPSMDKVRLEFTVKCNSTGERTIMQPLVFSGVTDGKAISNSVTYIGGRNKIDNYPLLSEINNKDVWNTSSTYVEYSIKKSISSSDNEVIFDYTYNSGNDFWAAPYASVTNSSVFENGYAVIFDAKAEVTKGELPENVTTLPARVYLYEESGEVFVASLNISPTTETSGDYTQIVFTENDFSVNGTAVNGVIDWDDIVGVRFGTNITAVDKFDIGIRLKLRNFGVYPGDATLDTPKITKAEIIGNKVRIEFGEKSLPVNNYNLYYIIDGERYSATYDPYDNSVTGVVGDESGPFNLLLSYNDILGVSHTISLSDVSYGKNKITILYNNAAIETKNTSLLAYDVSNVENPTAESQYIDNVKTPIIALSECDTSGKATFNIKGDYEGKLLVKLRREKEELMSFLLEVDRDKESKIKCRVTDYDSNSQSATIQSEISSDTLIIFAAHNGSKLVDCSAVTYGLKEGSNTISAGEFSVPQGCELSIYVWEKDSQSPLSPTYSPSDNNNA